MLIFDGVDNGGCRMCGGSCELVIMEVINNRD